MSEKSSKLLPKYVPREPGTQLLIWDTGVRAPRSKKSTAIHVATFTAELERIEDLDEVIIDAPKAHLVLDYPLGSAFTFGVEDPPSGRFTRRDIIRAIAETYREVYEKEDAASPPPPRAPGDRCMNRRRTNGPYGVWGHVLSDLFIEGVVIDRSTAPPTIYPLMGS